MEIKIVFYHVMHEYLPKDYPENTEFILNIDEDTTLQEVLNQTEETNADLSQYYTIAAQLSFNSGYLPYIINSQKKIGWDITFDKAKVKDFILTHNIKRNIIYADTGYVQAGGPGVKELSEIWSLIYNIMEIIVTTTGFVSISMECFTL